MNETCNYIVITSQYRWSRHSFIVKADANFYEKARRLICALESYKRQNNQAEPCYGDLDVKYFRGIENGFRYNVNDFGDIYFECVDTINSAIEKIKYHWDANRKDSVGYKRKLLVEDVLKHHDKDVVQSIISTYFEIL